MNRIVKFLLKYEIDKDYRWALPGLLGLLLIFEYIFGEQLDHFFIILSIPALLIISWFYLYCAIILPREDSEKYEQLIKPIKRDNKSIIRVIIGMFLLLSPFAIIIILLGIPLIKEGGMLEYVYLITLFFVIVFIFSIGYYRISAIRYKRSKSLR